jgi:lambda repressor-like predicted transcriptional regulator/transposase-like protein
VSKAVHSVYEDGMAFRRVGRRLARDDFWVEPSEATIRQWCREYAERLDFAKDYQKWVVEEFSGVLCVDEVYQGRLALLLAVDPASSPEGDRLIGYQLLHGAIEQKDVEAFLVRLRELGVKPEEVVTDGSPLYPRVLSEVWPQAAHQLCLFHEARAVTGAVFKAVGAVRKSLPKQPSTGGGGRRGNRLGRPRKHPHPEQITAYRGAIARVFALRQEGLSMRAISRRTGHSRNTVKKWLKGEAPKRVIEAEVPPEATSNVSLDKLPKEPLCEDSPELPPPPTPWESWEEIRKVRQDLWECRYLMLRRRDHLSGEEQDKLRELFESPVGERLRLVRRFLEEWYAIWYDEPHNRRTPEEARERYEHWRLNQSYSVFEPLAQIQARFDEERFLKISSFLEHKGWESTNNGAERTARAFRHLQEPHYNLRKTESTGDAIEARAFLFKEQKLHSKDGPPAGRSLRGRKARIRSGMLAAAA